MFCRAANGGRHLRFLSPHRIAALSLILSHLFASRWLTVNATSQPHQVDETSVKSFWSKPEIADPDSNEKTDDDDYPSYDCCPCQRELIDESPPFICAPDQVEIQARSLEEERRKGWSSKKWAQLLDCAELSPLGAFLASTWRPHRDEQLVLVHVGANKGYGLAEWISLFEPHLRISPQTWGAYMKDEKSEWKFDTWQMCGRCKECKRKALRRRDPEEEIEETPVLRIFGIEPLPENDVVLREFKRWSKYPDLTVIRAAASNFRGKGVYLKSRIGYENRAMVREVTPERERLRDYDDHSSDSESSRSASARLRLDEQVVPVIKLDGVVSKYGLQKIDWLRIDTAGDDLSVLVGAADTLLRQKVSILEFKYFGKANDRSFKGTAGDDLSSENSKWRASHWEQVTLQSVIERLDKLNFDCFMKTPSDFLMGSGPLVRLTNCFHSSFEMKKASNIICAHRREVHIVAFLLSHTLWL